jgi:RNA polymerase sigma factor (sigma-70 family)
MSRPASEVTVGTREEVAAQLAGCRAVVVRMVTAKFPSMSPADIEDVVQQAICDICRRLPTDELRSPEHYLFRAAVNVATDRLREMAAAPMVAMEAVGDELVDGRGSPEHLVSEEQQPCLALKYMEDLPEQLQTVLIQRVIDDIPVRKVARKLGVTRRRIQMIVVRGMRELTQCMSAANEGRRR